MQRLGTSLVVQWLRIYLPTQETRVWAPVQEDPMCLGATKPICCNYWAHALQQEKPHSEKPLNHNQRKATWRQRLSTAINKQMTYFWLRDNKWFLKKKCAAPRVNPNISYEPWVIIMYQYWHINCNKCTPLMLNVNNGRRESCSGIWELLYFLLNFSVNLKLLKKKK